MADDIKKQDKKQEERQKKQEKLLDRQEKSSKNSSQAIKDYIAHENMKEGKQNKRDGLNKENLERREKLSAEAKGISIEELKRQKDTDKDLTAKRKVLADVKAAGGGDSKQFKQMSKAIDEEEKVEKERREGQSTTLLEKIANNTKGLGKGIKDFVGKTPTGLKAIFAGIAFFALAKFLQSGTWKKIVSFIVDEIVPSLEKFYDDIMEFDFTLTGENGLIPLIKDNFGVLLGALAILKPKLLFSLGKAAVMGLFNSIKFMYTEMKGNFFGVKFAKTRVFMSKFKVASAAVGRGFKWTGNLLGKMVTGSLVRLKAGAIMMGKGLKSTGNLLGKMVTGPLVMLKAGAIKMMTGLAALGKGIMWIGKFLLRNPIVLLIVAIVAIIAAVVYYWDDIKQKFEDLGGVAGIFATVVANVKDALSSVANKLIKAYNFLTNSDVEMFDTDRAKKVNDKIAGDIESKKQEKKAQQDENKRAENLRNQYAKDQAEATKSIDEKTEKKKPLSFEEMTAASLTKMVGLMDGRGTNITTIQNDNSQNNNSQNNTHTNIPVGDPSYPQQGQT